MTTTPLSNPAAESRSLIDYDDTKPTAWHGGSYRGESRAAHAVANWHNETHPGAFSTCDLQPCHPVGRAEGPLS